MSKKIKTLYIILLMITITSGFLIILSIIKNPDSLEKLHSLEKNQLLYLFVSAILIIILMLYIKRTLKKERISLIKKLYPLPTDKKQNLKKKKIKSNKTLKEVVTLELPNAFSNNKQEILDDGIRFYMLNQIDNEKDKSKPITYNNNITLKELCEEFRDFSAQQLNLYYDIEDIRRFIGGLAITHTMILQGMSGTGKTSLAYAFGEYLSNTSTVVPIQPMWKERSDLIGYYNEFTKKFNETTLLQKMYEANCDDQIYITVLDEMNIARVEYYFAEFLSLLELPNPEKRYLDVIADEWKTDPKLLNKGKLILPDNMWFIGTANNDDSTFAISDKVYDRAMVINLDKKAKPFTVSKSTGRNISATHFKSLIQEAKNTYELSKRNERRLKELDKYLIKKFHITFGNRILQQIKNYIPVILSSGGTELEGLDDILSKKVLRKLETKNMVYVKSEAPDLISFLDDLFGENQMSQCKDYIKNIELSS